MLYAFQLIVDGFQAPEAASRQCGNFGCVLLFLIHDLVSFSH
jgi:hypothetical protein